MSTTPRKRGVLSGVASLAIADVSPEQLAEYQYTVPHEPSPVCGNCVLFEPRPDSFYCAGKSRADLPLTTAGNHQIISTYTEACSKFQAKSNTIDVYSYVFRGDRVEVDCGDVEKLHRVFPDVDWIDLRAAPPLGHNLEFNWELREYQKGPGQDLLKRSQAGLGTVMQAPTGAGKCVAGDSLLWTESGLETIEEHVGNDIDGFSPKVTNLWQGSRWVETDGHYREENCATRGIWTERGFWVEGTLEHPIKVLTSSGTLEHKKLRDIEPGDTIPIRYGSGKWGTELELPEMHRRQSPCVKEMEFPTEMSLGLASWLGSIISDGTVRCRVGFTSGDPECVERFYSLTKELFPDALVQRTDLDVWSSKTVRFGEFLTSLGINNLLSYQKQVPLCIRRAPREFVVAFLRSLYDGDGYVESAAVKYCTTSLALYQQLQAILLNFGVPVYGRTRVTNYTYKGEKKAGRRSYVLSIGGADSVSKFHELIGFTVARKQAQLQKLVDRRVGAQRERGNNQAMTGALPLVQRVYDRWSEELSKTQVIAGDNRNISPRPLFYLGGTTGETVRRSLSGERKVTRFMVKAFLEGVDRSPIETGGWEETNLLRDLLEGGYLDQVKSVHGGESKTVYDVSIPDGHEFWCNGFISHNTVMGTWLTAQLGLRTLILVDEGKLAEQWMSAFKSATNIEDLFEEGEPPPISIFHTQKNRKFSPITIALYQSLHSKKKWLEENRDLLRHFGLVIHDEMHVNASPTKLALSRMFASRVRVGLSATPTRKDKKHFLSYDMLGPVAVKVKIRQRCNVYYMKTGVNVAPNVSRFNMAQARLMRNSTRNEQLIRWLKYDIDQGRRVMGFALFKEPAAYITSRFLGLRTPSGEPYRVYSMTGETKIKDREWMSEQLNMGPNAGGDVDCRSCKGTGFMTRDTCGPCMHFSHCAKTVRRADLAKGRRKPGPPVMHNTPACDKFSADHLRNQGLVIGGKLPCSVCEGIGSVPAGAHMLLFARVGIKGLDVPNADCVHLLCPQSNYENTSQMVGRGLRWVENKKIPIVRDWLDGGWGGIHGAKKKRDRYYSESDPEIDKVPYPTYYVDADSDPAEFKYPEDR